MARSCSVSLDLLAELRDDRSSGEACSERLLLAAVLRICASLQAVPQVDEGDAARSLCARACVPQAMAAIRPRVVSTVWRRKVMMIPFKRWLVSAQVRWTAFGVHLI